MPLTQTNYYRPVLQYSGALRDGGKSYQMMNRPNQPRIGIIPIN